MVRSWRLLANPAPDLPFNPNLESSAEKRRPHIITNQQERQLPRGL